MTDIYGKRRRTTAQASDFEFDADLVPDTDSAYDIGSTIKRVRTGYFDTYDAGTSVTTPSLTLNSDVIALGNSASGSGTGVAIGKSSSGTFTGTAVGDSANAIGAAVAIGDNAKTNADAVAIGHDTGVTTGNTSGCVAIGPYAQQTDGPSGNQNRIAIGYAAGKTNADNGSICIGSNAGELNCGIDSICIGGTAGAPSHNNSIVINATGSILNANAASSCFIAPIDGGIGEHELYYDTSSSEVSSLARAVPLVVDASGADPAQSISSASTNYTVSFDTTVESSPDVTYSTSTDLFTINTTGTYVIKAQTLWSSSSSGNRTIYVQYSNNTEIAVDGCYPGVTGGLISAVTTVVRLDATDVIKIVVLSSVASQSIQSSNRTFARITRVS